MVYRLYNVANFTKGVFYSFKPETSIATIQSTVGIYTKSEFLILADLIRVRYAFGS